MWISKNIRSDTSLTAREAEAMSYRNSLCEIMSRCVTHVHNSIHGFLPDGDDVLFAFSFTIEQSLWTDSFPERCLIIIVAVLNQSRSSISFWESWWEGKELEKAKSLSFLSTSSDFARERQIRARPDCLPAPSETTSFRSSFRKRFYCQIKNFLCSNKIPHRFDSSFVRWMWYKASVTV